MKSTFLVVIVCSVFSLNFKTFLCSEVWGIFWVTQAKAYLTNNCMQICIFCLHQHCLGEPQRLIWIPTKQSNSHQAITHLMRGLSKLYFSNVLLDPRWLQLLSTAIPMSSQPTTCQFFQVLITCFALYELVLVIIVFQLTLPFQASQNF